MPSNIPTSDEKKTQPELAQAESRCLGMLLDSLRLYEPVARQDFIMDTAMRSGISAQRAILLRRLSKEMTARGRQPS